jgi:hypothetical protein
MHGAAEGGPEDFEFLMKRLFRFERGWMDSSPLLRFSRIVASRSPSGDREDADVTRLIQARTALQLLDRPAVAADTELRRLVARLPAPPVEIALVYAVLSEERERAQGDVAPGTVEGAASQLLLAELCAICCRAARTLRRWGLLPEQQDDSEGVVWASDAFQRIAGRCDCKGASCAWPHLHLLTSWQEEETHARRGRSPHFALRGWLERACFGYSPAFGKVGTFSQGLVAAIRPTLVVGPAAVRRCEQRLCAGEQRGSAVAKGRRCPRCDEEPAGAIRLVRKIVDRRGWALERFERCAGGTDEHFLTFDQAACPECHRLSRRDRSKGDVTRCPCGTWFPAQDACCPVCGTRVPRQAGIVQAWVHRPPPALHLLDPGHPRLFGAGASGTGGLPDSGIRPGWGIGLSPQACGLLNRLLVEGGRRVQKAHDFVTQVATISRDGRAWLGLDGEPSAAQRNEAYEALERLCLSVRTDEEEVLLRMELDRLLSAWHD